jgi:hypothetical protein
MDLGNDAARQWDDEGTRAILDKVLFMEGGKVLVYKIIPATIYLIDRYKTVIREFIAASYRVQKPNACSRVWQESGWRSIGMHGRSHATGFDLAASAVANLLLYVRLLSMPRVKHNATNATFSALTDGWLDLHMAAKVRLPKKLVV